MLRLQILRASLRSLRLGCSPSGVGSFAVPKSKAPSKKSKTGLETLSRLPGGVTYAARLASSQVSAKSKK